MANVVFDEERIRDDALASLSRQALLLDFLFLLRVALVDASGPLIISILNLAHQLPLIDRVQLLKFSYFLFYLR